MLVKEASTPLAPQDIPIYIAGNASTLTSMPNPDKQFEVTNRGVIVLLPFSAVLWSFLGRSKEIRGTF